MVLNNMFFVFSNRVEGIVVVVFVYNINIEVDYVVCRDFSIVIYWVRYMLIG